MFQFQTPDFNREKEQNLGTGHPSFEPTPKIEGPQGTPMNQFVDTSDERKLPPQGQKYHPLSRMRVPISHSVVCRNDGGDGPCKKSGLDSLSVSPRRSRGGALVSVPDPKYPE